MHCSANVGAGRRHRHLLRALRHRQDHALGRPEPAASSATTSTAGATTASSTSRAAATPRSSGSGAESEPEIYAATRTFGTVLENVVLDPVTRAVDFDADQHHREHPRLLPDRLHPEPSCRAASGGHPKNIVFLTADAFGVLPPIARLTPEQAMYHFLSGYTAKVAGTERGVTEPTATFSACFGAPFLPLHPGVYARMLGERIARHGAPGLAGEHRLDRRPVRRRVSG